MFGLILWNYCMYDCLSYVNGIKKGIIAFKWLLKMSAYVSYVSIHTYICNVQRGELKRKKEKGNNLLWIMNSSTSAWRLGEGGR